MTQNGGQAAARSFAFAIAGFILLSVGDGVVKSMAGAWPGTAVATLRYALGAVGIALILWRREGKAGFSVPMPLAQWGRAFVVSISATSFFVGVSLMPLAEAATIQFSNPLIVALLSAIFLKERASLLVWVSILLGFAGVLIVLRPNIAEIGPAAILPLISAIGMAFLLLLNRKVSGSGSIWQMQFLVAALAVPLLLLITVLGHFSGWAPLHVGALGASVAAKCAFIAVSATTAHLLIYVATIESSANDIAPTVYVQLITAMAIGYIFFGERFDLLAMAGSALIILGGLILWRYQSNRPSLGQ